MKPILFIGGEFLRRMTDRGTSVPEREDFRFFFSSYTATEDGLELSSRLVDSFNALRLQEIRGTSPDVLIWYLDWVASQDSGLIQKINTEFLETAWLAVDHDVLRTRTIESIVLVESTAESSFRNSAVLRIVGHLVPSDTRPQKKAEGGPGDSDRDDIRPIRLVFDTLLTEKSQYSLRVLGACIGLLSGALGDRLLSEIQTCVDDLGPKAAARILQQIETGMGREQ